MLKKIALSAALIAGLGLHAADSSGIFPNPQEETVGTTAFATAGVTYRLTGSADADADAVNALGRKLTVADAGTVEIVIGEAGDDAVASVSNLIPEYPQGYYLKVEPGKVTIAGRDALGTYYGVQSYLQLAAKAEVPSVEVKDWPRTEVRGVIEGYYGNPWSHEDCIDMCTFFDHVKMNTFIYGPKNDAYHHGGQVFDPYPEDQATNLAALVREANSHKVDIVWAMHPGNNNDGANLERAKSKLEAMYDLGFRRFAVFFDDISANSVQKQYEFMNYLNKNVVKAKGDVKGLIMCPSEYCISFAGGQNTKSTYLNELGAGLDPDIDIMWTGWQVVDMELAPSCEWFTNKTGRKPFIWHNYPCSDYGGRPLLMCPYEPAATDLPSRITGFTANPMEYYEASKVGLYGMGDFAWNPEAYDPWETWEESLAYMMPDHTDAFRTYCYDNFNYPSKSHGPAIIYQESPAFKELIDSKEFAPENAEAYTAYFNKQLEAALELRALTDNRLVIEIAEWLHAYELQGRRGLMLTELMKNLAERDADKFLENYTAYAEYTATAEALRSRDYEGTLRVLTPFSGSQFIEPFIANNVEKFVEEFKALGVPYPPGLFPARTIESGQYHILYNGKFLTNRSGSSYPTFMADADMVNPNRQIWNISYVPETGRYSLVSAEDSRYVNELGNFGTNEYSAVWNTYNIVPLGGLWSIQNGGNGGTKFWRASAVRVQPGDNTEWNTANFMFQIVPAGSEIPEAPAEPFADGEYIIKDGAGNLLTRPASGSKVTFTAPADEPTAYQKWDVTLDATSKRFKITQGTKYINEKGVIGSNQYYPEWNSYQITGRDGKFSIRNAGEAGTRFWTVDGDGIGFADYTGSLVDHWVFDFELVSKFNSIREVNAAPTADDSVYDLQGRKVAKPRNGIFIQNGQKVLFK